MADRKITDLTALAAGSQATGDLLTIVDVSEGAAVDKNKKITVESLFKGIPSNVGIGITNPGTHLVVQQNNVHDPNFHEDDDAAILIKNSASGSGGKSVIKLDNEAALVYGDGSSNLIFSDLSTERMRIDSSGNVGIGTSSPSELLHTVKASGTSRARFEASASHSFARLVAGSTSFNSGVEFFSGTTNTANITAEGDGELVVEANGSERMRIDSSGNVLTGNPGDILESQLTSGKYLAVVDTTNGAQLVARGQSPKLFFDCTDGGNGEIYIDGGNLRFLAGSPASAGGERMRIDSSGRLLLGTTSQGAGDARYSRVQIVGNTLNNEGFFRIGRNENTADMSSGDVLGRIFFTDGSGDPYGQIDCICDATPGSNDFPSRLTFRTTSNGGSSPTERMRITSNGQHSLYSEGSSARTSVINSGTSSGSSAFDIKNNATSTTTGTQVFSIRENGDIYTSGNTTVQSLSSERRLKENIEVIDPTAAWTTIKNTPYYSYNYIGQEGPRYGPIVDEVPAEMVRDTDLSDDQGPIRTFDNGMLHARLYAALQQAIVKIETLETSNADLLARVTALEAG